jgi:hypothetical protein
LCVKLVVKPDLVVLVGNNNWEAAVDADCVELMVIRLRKRIYSKKVNRCEHENIRKRMI